MSTRARKAAARPINSVNEELMGEEDVDIVEAPSAGEFGGDTSDIMVGNADDERGNVERETSGEVSQDGCICNVNKRVVDSYRSNLEDADLRNIHIKDIEDLKKADADVRNIDVEDSEDLKEKERKTEILAKSKHIMKDSIKTVETTPDL